MRRPLHAPPLEAGKRHLLFRLTDLRSVPTLPLQLFSLRIMQTMRGRRLTVLTSVVFRAFGNVLARRARR